MIDSHLRLNKMVEAKKIPHLLLLHGQGVEKEEEAYFLVDKLLGKRRGHPDLHTLHPEGKLGLHSIGSLSHFFAKASFKPSQCAYQIFLIYDAEKMLPSSSNALLKILEEPPSSSIFILLVNEIDRMLPTVLSRAQKLFISNNEEKKPSQLQEKMVNWLKNHVEMQEIEHFSKDWEERKKEREKELLQDCEGFSKEIEGEIALQFQREFFSLLEVVSNWYFKLNRERLGISCDMEKFQERAIPFSQVEKALLLAKTSYLRSMPIQAILETLLIQLKLL